MEEKMEKLIEEFQVKIYQEEQFFTATLKFKDGEEQATQGKTMEELYNMIADLLSCRLE